MVAILKSCARHFLANSVSVETERVSSRSSILTLDKSLICIRRQHRINSLKNLWQYDLPAMHTHEVILGVDGHDSLLKVVEEMKSAQGKSLEVLETRQLQVRYM
jgi:hypothetical protein